MCKTSIIRSFNKENVYKIVIGDSITDLEGAKIADWTIARSYLLEKCQELNLSHNSFTTFHDCIKAVKKIKEAH
jgi:2-hydroxy-3-keto-5-methylthiopentenyl-1-phosphate phosphatase